MNFVAVKILSHFAPFYGPDVAYFALYMVIG